jgi:hypothetical protein
MIKNSTYIRSFTSVQKNQLEIIAEDEKLKTVPEMLFFALENYLEQKKEIARLNRIIQIKQNKYEKLKEKFEIFESAAVQIHILSETLKV